MKKTILACLLVLCLSVCPLWLTGCGKKDAATVYMAVDTDAQADAFGKAAKAYEKETGNAVKLKTVSGEAAEKAKELSSKEKTPAVFLFTTLSEYETLKEHCADLSDSKVSSYLSDKGLALKSSDGDKIYAIPYDVSGYGIICNTGIINKYFSSDNGEYRYKSFEDISDFKSLKEFSQELQKRKSDLAIDSAFAAPSLKGDDAWEWNSGILNLPLYYEFSENDDYKSSDEAFFNSKEIDLRYDKEYRELTDLIAGNSTDKALFETKDRDASVKDFALGRSAMILGGDNEWSRINAVSGKTVDKDSVRFLPLYIDVSGDKKQGLTVKKQAYFAVNKEASDKSREAALDFLDWLFSSKSGKKTVTEDLKVLTPFNTFAEDELPDEPLKRETARYLKDTSVSNVLWVLGEPIRAVTKSDTASAIGDYIRGDKSFDETKTVIKDRWKMTYRQ